MAKEILDSFFEEDRPRPPRSMAELDAGMTNGCGLGRKQALKWGLAWPLQKGWRSRLVQSIRAQERRQPKQLRREEKTASHWLSDAEHKAQSGKPPW